ncbi:FKBP-type peptidyl-prolyl cis-trans isomerase [Nonomuraea glycinis]|uniref:Peptidyl-prolyl cis-trans isomerase n=1 Tax=Nonomuraea glycinis TaxID=2047744 RepID=A0A918E744_9ACTN|nr:FKBP-type peptidyl-prolyl cis-trans isomerase [Nonomuraea glycinis]MCA2177362.1 FKBP-type peptidyl-prolyl cis-trans isomerase [Nonomuraea glycinis]GGP09145.1 peptidylprolyl isomerase [Nonomuraea glycinis]
MRRRTIALLLIPLLAPAACSGSPSEPEVAGAFGARPTVVFPTGRPAAELRIDQLAAGSGATLEQDDVAIVQYTAHVWDGGANRLVDSSFNRGAPAAFPLGRLPPGLDRALRGRKVGSRVVAAIPPGDGLRDELLYVVDILGAHGRDTTVEAAGGSLAGVRVTGTDRPRLTVPRTAPPTAFTATVLSRGSGPATQTGRLLVAQYVGVVWDGGRVFDSTWRTGRPKTFTIGDGSVIRGWDRALLGVPVGSRVLMIVPPADGYGAAGHPPSGIRPQDTLVFAIDILAAY